MTKEHSIELAKEIWRVGFITNEDSLRIEQFVSAILEDHKRHESQRVDELLAALIEVSATLSWIAHGECRAFHEGPIMPSSMAVEVARKAINNATGEH